MIQTTYRRFLKAMNVFILSFIAITARAQDKVNLDTEKVESWFEKNWIWVAGAVLLLIIIALFSSRGRANDRKINQRKTTTVIKDPDGNVKSITTTEDMV